MHHKRGKPKGARSGCLMCKAHKFGHGMENSVANGRSRKCWHTEQDLKAFRRGKSATE